RPLPARRAHAVAAAQRPRRGPRRHCRAGQHPRHDGRASELAPPAARRHRGAAAPAAVRGADGRPARGASEAAMSRPTATYRLQFRGGMTLDRAAGLAAYLDALGISHLYASPVFTAAPGSTHGYDVADFAEIDPLLGGMPGFERLAAALRQAGLGLILDFVPNHMGAGASNRWWRDILEWGAESDYREHFDIDWSAPKLIVPALGEPYGQALQEALFGLALDDRDGGITFTYHDLRLP